MTLVIAQRLNDKVTFSSDSRMSFQGEGAFDHCIKIFKAPFRLKGPMKSHDDIDKWEFEYNYGLAVIGSTLNAYSVKDSISELIANLQYMSNVSDVSIAGVGSIIFKVYSYISARLCEVLRERGICEILLGGYCLIHKRIRILRYYSMVVESELKFYYEEILPKDGMLFFGSAKSLAESIYNENNSLQPLQIIKKAILSDKDATIGGGLQHGSFSKENFKISGVSEHEFNAEGKEVISKQTLRGFELNEQDVFKKPPYLFVSYAFTPVKPLPIEGS